MTTRKPVDSSDFDSATALLDEPAVGIDDVLASLRDSDELSNRDAQEWLCQYAIDVTQGRHVETSRLRETLDELKLTVDDFETGCRRLLELADKSIDPINLGGVLHVLKLSDDEFETLCRRMELLRIAGELQQREAAACEAMQVLSDNSAAQERERRELEERHAARHGELYSAQATAAAAAKESREALAELQRTSQHAAEYSRVMQERSRAAEKLDQLQRELQAAEREMQNCESEAERVGKLGTAAAELPRYRAAVDRIDGKIAEQTPIVERFDAHLAELAELVMKA